MYHGNNVGRPLYPWTAGQTHTLTYIMYSRPISFEPKSQLTINLDPGWECPSLPSEENKKRKRKFPIKDQKKAKEENSQSKIARKQKKKERKIPDQRSKENKIYRKVFRPNNIWTIQNCHQVNEKKKGNHDPKWPSPFDCQPKLCASMTCSPHTKQK